MMSDERLEDIRERASMTLVDHAHDREALLDELALLRRERAAMLAAFADRCQDDEALRLARVEGRREAMRVWLELEWEPAAYRTAMDWREKSPGGHVGYELPAAIISLMEGCRLDNSFTRLIARFGSMEEALAALRAAAERFCQEGPPPLTPPG